MIIKNYTTVFWINWENDQVKRNRLDLSLDSLIKNKKKAVLDPDLLIDDNDGESENSHDTNKPLSSGTAPSSSHSEQSTVPTNTDNSNPQQSPSVPQDLTLDVGGIKPATDISDLPIGYGDIIWSSRNKQITDRRRLR